MSDHRERLAAIRDLVATFMLGLVALAGLVVLCVLAFRDRPIPDGIGYAITGAIAALAGLAGGRRNGNGGAPQGSAPPSK